MSRSDSDNSQMIIQHFIATLDILTIWKYEKNNYFCGIFDPLEFISSILLILKLAS